MGTEGDDFPLVGLVWITNLNLVGQSRSDAQKSWYADVLGLLISPCKCSPTCVLECFGIYYELMIY